MKKRGFIFTLDALLSLVLISIFVVGIVASQSQLQSVYKTSARLQNKNLAQDTLLVLRTVPLNQLVPPNTINEWLEDGTLNTTLVSPDMTPLDIASAYWAVTPIYGSKFKEKAAKILGYILNSTIGDYNYELLINNWTNPFMTRGTETYNQAEDVSASTITLSGYEYNKTPSGFMARLYLAQITKQDEYIYMSDAVLSYPYFTGEWILGIIPKFDQAPIEFSYSFNINSLTDPQNKVSSTLLFEPFRLTKVKFEICSNQICNLLEDLLENVFGYLGSKLSETKISVNINGNPLIVNGKSYGSPTQIGSVHLKVTDNSLQDPQTNNLLEIIQKQNVFRFYVEPYKINFLGISLPFYAIGDSGASHVIIVYNVTKFNTMEFPHRFYFPTVVSNGNPTQIEKAIFIPFNITDITVRAKIDGVDSNKVKLFLKIKDRTIDIGHPTGVGDYFMWKIPTSLLPNLTNQYFSIVIGVGLEKYLKYPVIDFSNPEELPETHFKLYGNESYVEVKYNPKVQYSIHTISLTRPIRVHANECDADSGVDLEGEYCRHLEFSFDVPPNITPIWTKFQFTYYHDVTKDPTSQRVSISNSKIGTVDLFCYNIPDCNTQRDIIETFNHWGYGIWTRANDGSIVKPTMAPGENKFILDFGDGFYVSKDNSIGETLILLDSYVPYGDIFPYLLQEYPRYTGYNLTYYYQDISGTVRSDNLLIGVAYVTNVKYLNVDIDDIINDGTYKKYALDDAIVRLFQKLGGIEKNGHHLVIPIKLDSTVSDVVPLQRVPSLYTPIQVTLRIWRENG
ncbi:hypothetical protein FH039_02270 [Thermococcus indicus]|uniref:Uncharacterized protein n=1 Tax=Thermococcus indicus TaxID=2586643 RepID=A0A4Y5SIP9_9EURY|nr:hypothetical protein [Thermococcus indicus]QDA30673.1 hypothetical protein FH039_02270 [Thermococcus indicus]